MVCVLSERNGNPNWCQDHLMYHNAHYREYALDPGEKGERFRNLWNRIRDGVREDLPLPSYAKRAINYFASLKDHVANGSRMVSETERARRRSKCNGCRYRNREFDACSLCGCALSGNAILGDKLAWESSSCFNWKKYGVAVGCFNLPKLAELQIIVIGDKCGSVPILLCDDSPPGTERQQAHAALAMKYPNVEYWPNPENYGHHRGDASCFWKAIQWGNIRKLSTVCKLSMRHIFTLDNWLPDSCSEFEKTGHATGCVNCIDNNTRLFIRSESVLLNVRRWFDSGAYQELQGRNSYAPVVELHYNHIMCKHFGVKQWKDVKGECEIADRWEWPLMNEQRNLRTDGIIWHCSNGAEEYRALAKSYGIELENDFHTGGSELGAGYAKGYRIG